MGDFVANRVHSAPENFENKVFAKCLIETFDSINTLGVLAFLYAVVNAEM